MANAFAEVSLRALYDALSNTSLVISLLPSPTATTPALNQALILSSVRSTPPVGINNISGNISLMAEIYEGPTRLPGNILTSFAPAVSATATSVGVRHPGTHNNPADCVSAAIPV